MCSGKRQEIRKGCSESLNWKLEVWEYGKIEKAQIQIAPLTLLVGDNNSGKSYLMSLLWGICNLGVDVLLGSQGWQDSKEARRMMDWIHTQARTAWEKGSCVAEVSSVADELQAILDQGLERNKDHLVKKIFNSENVKIKKLAIQLDKKEQVSLPITRISAVHGESGCLYFGGRGTAGQKLQISGTEFFEPNENLDWFLVYTVFSFILNIPVTDISSISNSIYLPSARTGFMLTKDIINKVGRNTAFNLSVQEERVSPFTRPVNQFLDVINDLTIDDHGSEKFSRITEYLQNGMAEGTVDMSMLPGKEVLYVPSGQTVGMPLRIVSAVVTELSPLILILKHREYLNMLFYEEPEMCLHPQLQQKMAKVICRLVNSQVGMVVTTHSDIVLQHINNMIRLSEREDREELCRQFGYTVDDLLKAEQVRVYQIKAGSGGRAAVEELQCGRNGFVIPSFNDALDRIMDEAYTIQE